MQRKNRSYVGPLDPAAKEALQDLQMHGEPDLYAELIRTYLKSSEEFLKILLSENDIVKRKKMAHSWKSSSASVGALDLSDLCAELEQAPERGELVPEIAAAYALVKAALA